MNLHLLRLFTEVARLGGFSRAAAALRISQPAVSKGVREFEAQLGVRLLERGPGGVRLTEAGSRLAGRAAALFAVERAAEEDLAALRGLDVGRLQIGASTTIATYLLPAPLAAFAVAHPGIELQVTSANTAAIAALLLRRELDIALVEGPVALAGVQAAPWRQDAMILIAAPGHPAARAGRPVAARDLAGERFVVREAGSGTAEAAAAAMTRLGLSAVARLEIGSTEAIKQVVAAGLGLAFVSTAAAADQIALGRLAAVPVAGFSFSRTLAVLSLPDRLPSPAARAFAALL
jgi:DNA-binding transcriptional LysR family regulator